MTEVKTEVKIEIRESDNATIPIEEPYATAFRKIDGLWQSPGAVYEGVRFSRKTQSRLGYWPRLMDVMSPEWPAIRDAGGGTIAVSTVLLAKLIAQAGEIDQIVQAAKAAGPVPLYYCVEGGCRTRVSQRGARCWRCRHDEL